MKRHPPLRALVLTTALGLLAACGGFDDPTPETLSFRMDGPAGTEVDFIFSKYFAAGTNEIGNTRVEVALADTLRTTLPMDSVFDIALEKRWFVMAIPVGTDGVPVDVLIEVNDRNVLAKDGDLFVDDPWLFVYMFNQRVTEGVDVVF